MQQVSEHQTTDSIESSDHYLMIFMNQSAGLVNGTFQSESGNVKNKQGIFYIFIKSTASYGLRPLYRPFTWLYVIPVSRAFVSDSTWHHSVHGSLRDPHGRNILARTLFET